MTEQQIMDHQEEWNRQEIDDKEYLRRRDALQFARCGTCLFWNGTECRNINSPLAYEYVDADDSCDEWSEDDDE